MPLFYLTVQDVLWAHFQITGRSESFDYSTLEEACFYQYGYGGSEDLVAQAGRLLEGFRKLSPFASANAEVAWVVTDAFLRINGSYLDARTDEAQAWISGEGHVDVAEVARALEHHHAVLQPDVQGAIEQALASLRPRVEA